MKTRLLAVPLVLIAALALPCLIGQVEGVHFKNPSINFGLPPARAKMYQSQDGDALSAWRPGTRYAYGEWQELDWDERERRDDLREKRHKRLTARAFNAETSGRLADALRDYRAFGDAGAFAAARRELLATPGLAGARSLTAYLKATNPLSQRRFALPKDAAPVLRPWLDYARAATADDYLAVATRYPDSTRAGAALVMAGRLLTQRSKPSLLDLQAADAAFRRLLLRHPRSRFAWSARGGLARVAYLRGRFEEARRGYETQFSTAKGTQERTRALESIVVLLRQQGTMSARAFAFLRLYETNLADGDPFTYERLLSRSLARFSGTDARAFWDRLRNDPPRLATYVEWHATNGEKTGDLEALATPALRLAARDPRTQGRIAAALARVALGHGDMTKAAHHARLALRVGGDDEQALGLYALATVDRRAGRLRGARDGYARIVRDHPKSYLVGGARESLALLSERLGDLGAAMDGYRKLGYDMDIAYLADVRMTPAELAAYLARHPKADVLRYTLAMRLLRKGRWDDAERALRGLPTSRRRSMAAIAADWDGSVQDPLATVRALRRLDREARTARGREAKAAALIRMGDYYYRHKCLLLYSAPLWRGERDPSVSFSWNAAVATAKDSAALHLHYDEHECYAQALLRYRRVVREFPRTKVASLAAYRGAVCAERLSGMAPYWRWRERTDDRKGESVRLMAFAARSKDPDLARRARKYGKVFVAERKDTRQAFADEKSPQRRWAPEW